MPAVYNAKKDNWIVITEDAKDGAGIGFTDPDGTFRRLHRYHKDSCLPTESGEVWEACKEDYEVKYYNNKGKPKISIRSRWLALRPLVKQDISLV